jgi:hypothetical protein
MTKANQVSIPYLDPSVQHVGISRLRALNVTQLRELDKTLVIQDNDKPLAVLLKYEHFLAMQARVSLTLHCCECGTELQESETYEFGGTVACEKCVKNYYKDRPAELEIELQSRRRNAAAYVKRNRPSLEKQSAKRAAQK